MTFPPVPVARAPSPPVMRAPPPPGADSCADTECYRNYWSCMFDTGEDVELWNDQPYVNGQPTTRAEFEAALQRAMARYRVVTFNGLNYDMRMVALALQGAGNTALKEASDSIIVYQVKPWDIAEIPAWINHVDLIEVAPGQASLKMYGGKMHSRTIRDLPYPPDAIVDAPMRAELRTYCRNDLRTTRDMLETFPAQLELRDQMGTEYGLDLRSKSDAQIAEAIFKKLLPFKVNKPQIQPGARFLYRPPAWMKFERLDVLATLARCPFVIGPSGSPVMSDELAGLTIQIGDGAYRMGSGGLHSSEEKVEHVADEIYSITDHDVASYYPALILRTGIYPHQIGLTFQDIYRGWFERRIAAKRAGQKKIANSLKIVLNGTFGKLGSPWSIFYAPSEMIQVTLTGQLALLMLIERFEMCGIRVISANTDGIVIKCRRDMEWLRDDCVAWWQAATGFEMEQTDYRRYNARDVNAYVAIKTDGEVKTKGAYAPPDPGPSGWPNPTGQISVDACVAYLRDGTPLETTVYQCRDVRQFVHVRQVKGGGSYCPNGSLSAHGKAGVTLKYMRTVTGAGVEVDKAQLIARYAEAVRLNALERQYLGKAVRWYLAADCAGVIVTQAGGQVATATGCRPMMTLTDDVPPDVDYARYVQIARDLLADLGVTVDGAVNKV